MSLSIYVHKKVAGLAQCSVASAEVRPAPNSHNHVSSDESIRQFSQSSTLSSYASPSPLTFTHVIQDGIPGKTSWKREARSGTPAPSGNCSGSLVCLLGG